MMRPGASGMRVYGPALGLAAVMLASAVGPAVAASPATACSIPSPRSEADQLQADLAEQADAWARSSLVYLGVVVESGPPARSAGAPTSPPRPRPGAQQRRVRVIADRVLKGRLPQAALTFDFLVDVHCVPSDLARSAPGDRLVVYAGASGPDDRSGAIRLDRIRDPVTVGALGEIDDVASGDLNQDGTLDTALLFRSHGAAFAGLEIHLREPHGDLRRSVAVPDFAWGALGGGRAGSRPSLSLSDDGALLVHEQNLAAGADRFEQTRTLEWRAGRFILSRFQRTNWSVGRGATDRCTVDLSGGNAVWNDRSSQFAPTDLAVEQATRWSSCEELIGALTDNRVAVAPPSGSAGDE